MTKKQENTLSMFAPVETILMENAPVWSVMPAMVAAHERFLGAWSVIDPDAQKQVAGTTGKTAEKSAQRTELARLASLVSGNIYAYAGLNNKTGLQQEMAFTEPSLERMRDNILLVTARMVRDKAAELSDVLTDYGVSTDQITALSAAITGFELSAGTPRKSIVNIKTATAKIKENMDLCLAQLDIMDRLMENFRANHPVFVTDYFNARRIVDLGHRKAAAKPTTQNPPASAN